jgi:hypothetical protein
MGRSGGVTDFLPSLFVRVPELFPAARFFRSLQRVMAEREERHFHITNPRRVDDSIFHWR